MTGGVTRLAVVVHGGRHGDRAVVAARELATGGGVQITLVAVVAHLVNTGCTISAGPLNEAVEAAAQADLAAAANRLGDPACARVVLRERLDPSLADWALGHGVGTVLLPGRTGAGTGRVARALSRAGLDVRVI